MTGKRTYILMALLFIAGGAQALGYIDSKTYENIAAFLVPAGIATLRGAVSNNK